MAIKLAIADLVKVPVKFQLTNGGKVENHDFELTCARLSADVIRDRSQDKSRLVADFIREVARDWSGQTLVVDDACGKAAPFSSDSLDLMLSVPGVPLRIYEAYLVEVGAREKN